jgi:hypothetical protein
MTVKSKARQGASSAAGGRLRAAAACALAVAAAGEARAQQFTIDQLARMSGNFLAGEFPLVRAGLPVRARFDGKHFFTIADGTRQMMFMFRSSNCWLRERTLTERPVIECRETNPGRAIDHPFGPGVFIPVLFVTPASQPRSSVPPVLEFTLRRRNASTTFADYVPYGDSRVGFWIKLANSDTDALKGNVPAAPAALVLCVPLRDPDCYDPAAMLINLDDTPPEQTAPPAAAPGAPAAPPSGRDAMMNPLPRLLAAAGNRASPPAGRRRLSALTRREAGI